MKRLGLIVVAVIMILSATYGGSGVGAQDATEPTVEALKTRVSELKATAEARGEKINEQRTRIAELESGGEQSVGETPTAAPLAAADADWIEASAGVRYHAYAAPNERGEIYLYGEVENTTGAAIAAPGLYVTLLDEGENIVGASSLIALFPNVEDQSRTPYQVFLDDVAPGTWTSQVVEIGLSSLAPITCTLELRDVAELQKTRDVLEVTGSVYNGGDAPVGGVTIYAAYYREDGVFAGSSSDGDDQGTIPPDRSSRFNVFGLRPAGLQLPDAGDDYTYRLLVINVDFGTVYC